MVNIVESNNRRSPPRRAVDVYPELQTEIDARIAAHVAQYERSLRVLVYKGIATIAVPLLGMMFYLGQLTTDFHSAIEMNNKQDAILQRNRDWTDRKDSIDDDLIRFMRTQGYTPPPWYRGRDYEEITK